MSELHNERVQTIAAKVRERVKNRLPVRILKGGVSHFVPLQREYRDRAEPIDISALCEVLSVDPVAKVCVAEPGATFQEVVRATLKHGLVPTVVPELEGITVGGAVAGGSVESMSYRYGGFHDSCTEYEVITGNGEIQTLSPQHKPLEFEMVHGSYGTLAIVTRLTFKLIPAKPFVHMTYVHLSSTDEFHRRMMQHCKAADYDFIDGIVHSPHHAVLCLGRFTDAPPAGKKASNYKWLNIFYKSTLSLQEDTLTTEDYFFRYDTECHWLTKTIPGLEMKVVRFLVGKWVLGSTKLIQWARRLDGLSRKIKLRPDVVVDVFIPEPRLPEFFAWYLRTFHFFPLWVIPYKAPQVYPWVATEHGKPLHDIYLIDCAVYGKANSDPNVDYSDLLEKKTYELGGIKTLISRNHHTPAEFWKVFNKPNYDAAKKSLDPLGVFTGLYEKFHKSR